MTLTAAAECPAELEALHTYLPSLFSSKFVIKYSAVALWLENINYYNKRKLTDIKYGDILGWDEDLRPHSWLWNLHD